MSHTFQISDEEYANIVAYTEGRDETPETLFQYWVQGKIDRIRIILGSTSRQQANQSKGMGQGSLDPSQALKQISQITEI
jgi:hypothetical protein